MWHSMATTRITNNRLNKHISDVEFFPFFIDQNKKPLIRVKLKWRTQKIELFSVAIIGYIN